MPCFRCSKCGCVENAATSNYWVRESEPLCSECDPEIGVWHQKFEKKFAKGYLLGSDGFLYSIIEDEDGSLDWRKKNQGFRIVCVL